MIYPVKTMPTIFAGNSCKTLFVRCPMLRSPEPPRIHCSSHHLSFFGFRWAVGWGGFNRYNERTGCLQQARCPPTHKSPAVTRHRRRSTALHHPYPPSYEVSTRRHFSGMGQASSVAPKVVPNFGAKRGASRDGNHPLYGATLV